MIEDPRITAYIDRAAPFAQPILTHLRSIARAACPDVEETIKWGMPSFVYRGKILCNMAAFKQHASFGFWQGKSVTGDAANPDPKAAMGSFGRLTSLADLPDDDAIIAMIGKAMMLIDTGTKAPRPLKHPKPPAALPNDLTIALAANAAASATFEGFPPGQRREYIDWILDAKREETRAKRVAQAVEWLAEGKRRNWKYENC